MGRRGFQNNMQLDWLHAAAGFVAVAVLLPVLLRRARGSVNYKGKHVVISGGSSGIGLALAKEFAKRGSHVTILARTESKLKDAVEEITKFCTAEQKISYVSADMTDYAAVQRCVAEAQHLCGPPDVLIANA